MAKNWKRAHDNLKAELDLLTVQFSESQFSLKIALTDRDAAEKRASLACAHMEAAAEQFVARNVPSTAALLRREADRLYPYRKTMALTNTKTEEPRR